VGVSLQKGIKMGIREDLKSKKLFLDGSMGTLLQNMGLKPGELPEKWNITHPEVITEIHKNYFDAGANIVCTNTFGANSLKFGNELEEIIACAITNAKKARELSSGSQNKYIALDIGPLGRLLKPYGDLDFEEAVSVYSETVNLGVKYGVDLIFIETMSDSYETKAAVLAAKENSELPVFVSNAYGEDGKLLTGATPEAMAVMLEGLGVDALGANCSLGPKQLMPIFEALISVSSVPVFAKPNAGLPRAEGGKVLFDVTPAEFAEEMKNLAHMGVMIYGGCCGTTPDYIRETFRSVSTVPFKCIEKKDKTLVSSYTHSVEIGEFPVLIGERINPTGKKRFKEAILERDMDYILKEGLSQQEKKVHILDVNVGLPGIDEAEFLENTVFQLQSVINTPLQIDTSDFSAMEKAMRIYNGKPMVNSVNGKMESMERVFPLVKKYGGVVVALTLDEKGIPATAEGRVEIAKNILRVAEGYGIDKKDIVFDTLCLSVSADKNGALATLEALKTIRNELGCNTVLGVSNVSFGLPERDILNGVFFSLALNNGLSAGIINPHSFEIMKAYYSFLLLKGLDENCGNYIDFMGSVVREAVVSEKPVTVTGEAEEPLADAIIKGLKDRAAALCDELLKSNEPLEIVNKHIVPALDTVGKGFENKTVYLPQLLMSAEAAKTAFEKIKVFILEKGGVQEKKCKVVIATVKGDIHDIGKNIVKVLLENYGFSVIDLGKDVSPEAIAEAVAKEEAPLCGLSALMTTTVPAMEETVALIHKAAPYCKVMVGGAVLTREFAEKIGADCYGKDAMEAVRYAEKVYIEL